VNASRSAFLALVLTLPLSFSVLVPAEAGQGSTPKALTNGTKTSLTMKSILPVQLRFPDQVQLIADGRSRSLKTTALTVSDVLKDSKIVLGPLDLINIPLSVRITDGVKIRVTRIKQVSLTKQVKIPYAVKKIKDKKMLVGKRIIKSKGVSGLAEVHLVKTIADGKVVKTTVLSNVTLKAAHPAQIIVGIRPRTIDELNWKAMAFCESRGNPRSSNSANGYFGMFQFTLTAWKSVGGVGNPMDASAAEQLMRAKLLYKKRGWGPWPVCGKRLFS